MIAERFDAVFLEAALFDAHLAFAASQAATADALDFHAHVAGGIQQGCAFFHARSAARGHEDDERFFFVRVVVGMCHVVLDVLCFGGFVCGCRFLSFGSQPVR